VLQWPGTLAAKLIKHVLNTLGSDKELKKRQTGRWPLNEGDATAVGRAQLTPDLSSATLQRSLQQNQLVHVTVRARC
jgi:hypothetical protein